MGRLLLFLLLSIIIGGSVAKAQSPEQIIKRSLASVNAHPYISFKTLSFNKNLFSDKDTSVTRTEETIRLGKDGRTNAQNVLTLSRNGKALYRKIYYQDTAFTIDLKDSVFSYVAQPKSVNNSLGEYIEQIEKLIDKKMAKVVRLKDTIIGRSACYNLFVRSYDTVEHNNHNYTHRYIVIDKTTMFPAYQKEIGSGSASKGGYDVGRVHVFNEITFSSFTPLTTISPKLFTFSRRGLDPENKTMLIEGAVAPPLTVKALSGKNVQASFFRNKVVLIQFGSTTCAANPLSNPVMNRLNKQYIERDVQVIGIYSDETSKQAKDYIEANGIAFPVYLGNAKLKKQFKTISTPNFYLIDKKGKVIKSIEGYSDKLEQQLDLALAQAVAN